MAADDDLVVYVNGEYLPRSEAAEAIERVRLYSAGGFFDHERTFGGRLFRLGRNLDRLYRGLARARMVPGVDRDAMERITKRVLEVNLPRLKPGDEFEVTQVVTVARGGEAGDVPGFDVVVYCDRLDFAPFALGYARGVRVVTPATYGVPAANRDDGVKTFPLMLDSLGRVTECAGGNFMFVKGGRIKLPNRRNVLAGVSMGTVLELAESLGIAVDESDYTILDVYQADEVFLSATVYCMIPAQTFNGLLIGDALPGPVTARLLDAWRELVGVDFAQQALDSLARGGPAAPPSEGV